MKRISILAIVMLAIAPGVTKARSYCPPRYRVRWSPYASGLISGDVYYSPYAYQYGHSGLVPGNFRYSPYAYGYKRSGLVADPWGEFGYYPSTIYYDTCYYSSVADCGAYRSSDALSQKSSYMDETQASYEEKLEARKERLRKLRQSRQEKYMMRAKDGKEIISAYLKIKDIDFRTNRIFQIENKTISVDFLLKDRNIIIKYWNPVEILSLEKQADYRRDFFKRYLESWKDFCGKYQGAGGKIYQIISADTEEIITKLLLCPELSDG